MTGGACLILCVGLLASRAAAQDSAAGNTMLSQAEQLRELQLVQLVPHLLLFDPHTTTATVAFRNPSDSVRQAQVLVQFAYIDEPHGLPADTMVIDPRPGDAGSVLFPHDTVLATPGPKEPFAGRWLSGVPTSITLAPRQTKRITVRLTPPPQLPAGEYWARIVTVVQPTDLHHRGGGSKDERQRYMLPAVGRTPLLRDTCAVIYRQGVLHEGLAIGSTAVARIDAANVGGAGTVNFSHGLWVRLPLHLTGNVPFRGMLHAEYHNLTTGEIVNPNSLAYVLMKDAVDHMVVTTNQLSPGPWELTLTFDTADPSLAPALRLPMTPVKQSFRFDLLPTWQY